MMHFLFKAMALALLLPAVHGMGLCVAAELDKVDVPLSGQNEYQFYRIPAIVTAPDGKLLAFCEGRKSSRSDDGDIDLLLRRSRDGDCGKTWLWQNMAVNSGAGRVIRSFWG